MSTSMTSMSFELAMSGSSLTSPIAWTRHVGGCDRGRRARAIARELRLPARSGTTGIVHGTFTTAIPDLVVHAENLQRARLARRAECLDRSERSDQRGGGYRDRSHPRRTRPLRFRPTCPVRCRRRFEASTAELVSPPCRLSPTSTRPCTRVTCCWGPRRSKRWRSSSDGSDRAGCRCRTERGWTRWRPSATAATAAVSAAVPTTPAANRPLRSDRRARRRAWSTASCARFAANLGRMEPETVVGRDPAPEGVLVTDQAFGYSSARRHRLEWGSSSSPNPSGSFERLLSRKGATTTVHQASRIPSDLAERASPGGSCGSYALRWRGARVVEWLGIWPSISGPPTHWCTRVAAASC